MNAWVGMGWMGMDGYGWVWGRYLVVRPQCMISAHVYLERVCIQGTRYCTKEQGKVPNT